MKNKYVYILLGGIFTIILVIYFAISYLNDNFHTKSDKYNGAILKNGDKIIKDNYKKEININMDNFDPSVYKSVNEFLGYFINGSGVTLNVDLLKETFYVNKYLDNGFIITKFDKKLITEIDNSNSNIKSEAILDIFNSYKKDGYIYGDTTDKRSGVRLLEQHELSSNMQLHNNILLPYDGESSLEIIKRLEAIKNKTVEDKQQLSYLYDFSGDYNKSLELKQTTNIEKISYKIEGRVFNSGNSLKGAKIEVLNYNNIEVYTNDKGEYILEFETYPLTRLRLRASFDSLSDGYNGVYVIFDYDNQLSENIDFSLHGYNTKELITGKDLLSGKTKTVKSTLGNTFEFKKGVILDKKGKIYNGDFYVEIFEFDRNTPGMENFLSLDTFDEVFGYTGNMMITNGMTYLLIRDFKGNELFISKKNPIITRQNLDIKYMLNNSVNGTSILTKEELNLILEKSKENGYPIDRGFLVQRGITGYFPWWVLNRTRGIRENASTKLLNINGLEESFYYNVD